MTLGWRIRSRREELGMTQEELAKRLGTTKQTIHKYEQNIVTNIPLKRVKELSVALETSIPDLLQDDSIDWTNYSEFTDVFRKQYGMRVLFRVARDAPTEDLVKWAKMIEIFRQTNGKKED